MSRAASLHHLIASPTGLQDAADWGGPRTDSMEDDDVMLHAHGGYSASAQRPAETVRCTRGLYRVVPRSYDSSVVAISAKSDALAPEL